MLCTAVMRLTYTSFPRARLYNASRILHGPDSFLAHAYTQSNHVRPTDFCPRNRTRIINLDRPSVSGQLLASRVEIDVRTRVLYPCSHVSCVHVKCVAPPPLWSLVTMSLVTKCGVALFTVAIAAAPSNNEPRY